MKKRRQKTEHVVAKIAKDNPEMLGEKSKEILSRLESKTLVRSNQLDEIDPALKKKPTGNSNLYDSVEKSSFKYVTIVCWELLVNYAYH